MYLHQTAAVIGAVPNEGEISDEGDDNEMEGLSEQEIIAEQDQKQLFMVDYCKRGTTKCRKCKKKIPSAALRIGKSAKFRTRDIYHYFHVTCAFQSFEKARSSANTITCMDDILGFDLIRDDERVMILQLMDEVNAKRMKNVANLTKKVPKRIVPMGESAKTRVTRLKSSNLPTLDVLYTNADQLTASKMTELKKLV